jgi:hypothetical protein
MARITHILHRAVEVPTWKQGRDAVRRESAGLQHLHTPGVRRSLFLPLLAGLSGTVAGAAYAFLEGTALSAKAPEYEMDGIPLLFASVGLAGFLLGVVAALCYPARPYLSAAYGVVLLDAVGIVAINSFKVDSNIVFMLAPTGFKLPFVAWGALAAEPAPTSGRRILRDVLMVPAFLMAQVGVIALADHWLPGKAAWLVVLAVALFFLWLMRRNRRLARAVRGSSDLRYRQHSGPESVGR